MLVRARNFRNNSYIEYKINGDKNEKLSINDKIKLYLKNIIDLQKSDTLKIQLTMAIRFIFSKDTNEESVMHSKIYDIEVMTYDDPEEVIEELFESILSRYQTSLEMQMRGSDFFFDC